MSKRNTMAFMGISGVSKEPSETKTVHDRQGTAFVPTEEDARKARARMRPEVRKAHEKSLKQFGGAYKRLADM